MTDKRLEETVDHLIVAVAAITANLDRGPSKELALIRLAKISAIKPISPAPVSNGKSLWSVGRSMGGKSEILLNGKVFTVIDDTRLPAFRTLIAREKLCDKMAEWMKRQCTEYPYPSDMIGWYLSDNFKRFLKLRDTLIAEYEEVAK